MQIIQKLQNIVNKNCIVAEKQDNPIKYWSEVIFSKCTFYAIPLSLIAIIPGVIITIELERWLILWVNLISFFTLLFVAYAPKITVQTRKIITMVLIYSAAFVLLKEMGYFGPGLTYILGVQVLILVLFPDIKNPSISFLITLFFCLFYGLLIQFKWVNVSSDKNIDVFEWVAVSSNLLFLSAIFSMIIPFLFSKIRTLLEEKNRLLVAEKEANATLQNAITLINQKNTELEQFTFIVSHDLQEPLRTIRSFIDKFKAKYADHENVNAQQYLYFIAHGADRMKQLIADLLVYSQAHDQNDTWQEINLNEFMKDYLMLRTTLIQENNASLQYQHLPVIRAPKVPFAQTMHSLLDNAIKFVQHKKSPLVEIACEEKEQFWEFRIKDNGIGIDALSFHKIFMLFQQLHNRDTYAGTGMGLALAKKNIELLGGKIWLNSTPGFGSTFYFTIPRNKSDENK